MKNQIKTFEEACKALELDPEKVIPTFEFYPEQDRKAMISHAKLVIIARAANKIENDGKEWIADYNDSSQIKYEPWFITTKNEDGSSGFRYHGCGIWCTGTGVGSRLCFISGELCKYIATTFIDLYKEYKIK